MEGLTGEQLKQFFAGGLTSLAEHQKEIDRLNVFPVPDGDTGRNMYLTMVAALKELNEASLTTVDDVCDALAKGSLMGARGNSGVILSQLIRGLSDAVRGKDTITMQEFARAWQMAVTTAYRAVIKPVEGTMLTVARGFSQGLNEAAASKTDWLDMFKRALQRGQETLQRTPEMLPELKRAGVVDAGGKGLLVILEGGLQAIQHQNIQAVPAERVSMASDEVVSEIEADFCFLYCTNLLLKGDLSQLDKIRVDLRQMGSSMVIGGAGDLIKLHIHANHPGQILEYMLQYGTVHNIEITNMKDQWEENHNGATLPQIDEQPFAEQLQATAEVDPKEIGLVAVVAGVGLIKLFTDLGVQVIIEGGQTMNPSVEDFVHAIEQLPYERVIVMPNNKNLILAAEQAKQFTQRQAVIVPSKSIQAGIAAILAFNGESSLEENQERMTAQLGQVKAGEVTYAVRDAEVDGRQIKQGELIGLSQGKIMAAGQTLEELVPALLSLMVSEHDELITIFAGSEVADEQAGRITSLVSQSYPDLEVEAYYGGQPVYYYLISVE